LVLVGATMIVVWRRTLGHVRHKFWIALALFYTFLLPWTAFTIYNAPEQKPEKARTLIQRFR
jgi:hypothetical protein